MSDDLTGVEYGLPKATEEPPHWGRSVQGRLRKFPKVLTYVAAVTVVVMALFVFLSIALPPAPQAPRSVWNGRLADVTGDDVLYRLEVTQAALQREVAVLGKLLSGEGVPLPEDAEVTLALATLAARQDQLDALVSRLEAGQTRLRDVAETCRMELSMLSQRLSDQGQALDAHFAEKGD